jgi:KDO2-lipid IV(A) lauroyltransferase
MGLKLPQNSLHRLEARLMNSFSALCERSSWEQCRLLGSWLGLLFHGALPSRRRVSTRNLQLAFQNLSATQANYLARRASQNACMTFCEFMRMGSATEAEIRSYCDIEGYENFQSAMAHGKGVLLLTGHLGNWEVMGARATLESPLTVIARPRSNKAVHEKIEAIRARNHVQVISRFDTGRAPLKVLRAGLSLGVLPDQYEKDGPLLPFFGQPTRVVDAVARLAILSGAPVVPAFGVRRDPWLRDGRIIAKVFPAFSVERTNDREVAVREGTLRCISELEKIMTSYPDQWLWMHRRWRQEDDVVFTPPR